MYYFILTFHFATLLSNLITELDPLIKNQMKTNVLSTIFTRYGKSNVNKPSNYRYPKVTMDIRNNWEKNWYIHT